MAESIPWLPHNFSEWLPLWQALAFFLATFILEDVATIGAGLLLAVGAVSWEVAFWACFLGIWAGDAGLYAIARCAGRTWFEQSRLRRFSGRVQQSEQWFARRGTPILVFSRLVPGARLPTYLAAGFLRLPLDRFLFVTGIASLFWTIAILVVSHVVGAALLDWLGRYKHGAWAILGSLLIIWGTLHLARTFFSTARRRRISAAWGRIFRWEFWPGWMFYPPVAFYCLWLAIKYRGLTAPTMANPGILTGGIVGESKMAMLKDLCATSPDFTAEAELLEGETTDARLASLESILARRRIDYPFILKPDVGQRGAGVKLIRSRDQATACLRGTPAPMLVQRYVPGPFEAGVFYYRFPGETRGHIFAITEKIFPFITGDGRSTVSDLIWADPRARFIAGKYLARLSGRENEVPAAGEKLRLVEAGNHAAGCIFIDGKRLNTPELTEAIDAISQRLNGFCIGRYDVRYADESEFKAGRGFQIIELNGAASEATNIYDARNSLLSAYRTLCRQWELVFAIGAENRRLGCPPTSAWTVWKLWREYAARAATYPPTD